MCTLLETVHVESSLDLILHKSLQRRGGLIIANAPKDITKEDVKIITKRKRPKPDSVPNELLK